MVLNTQEPQFFFFFLSRIYTYQPYTRAPLLFHFPKELLLTMSMLKKRCPLRIHSSFQMIMLKQKNAFFLFKEDILIRYVFSIKVII